MSELRQVLFVSGTAGSATLRYRVRLAEEALRSRGVRTAAVHFTEPMLRSWAKDADVIALYRVPLTKSVDALVRWARARGTVVTFDVDDRVFLAEHAQHLPFLGRLNDHDRAMFLADLPRRGATAALADRASGTADAILSDLRTVVPGPVELLPNGVGRTAWARASAVRRLRDRSGRVRLGYFSGSATHDDDWAAIEPDVVSILDTHPHVQLWLVGPVAHSAALAPFRDRVQCIEPVKWEDLFLLLAEVDINLAPLADSPFTRAKSAIKWLEAALVETPTVATATQPFQYAVVAGTDGLLIPPGDSWLPVLAELVADREQLTRLGQAARSGALERFGPEVQADRYVSYFQQALDTPRATPTSEAFASGRAATRVVTGGVSLEPYPFPADLQSRQVPAPAWGPVLSKVRTVARKNAARVVRRLPSRGAA